MKISDIKLPGDAEPTITDRDFTIATIAGRTATTETTTEEGEEAEGEEPAAEADAESED